MTDSIGFMCRTKPTLSHDVQHTSIALKTLLGQQNIETSGIQNRGLSLKQGSAEVCPNLATMMVYNEISDGEELEVFMAQGQSDNSL